LTSILSAFSNARTARRDAAAHRKLHRSNPIVSTASAGTDET
jgi:hypothetical protein